LVFHSSMKSGSDISNEHVTFVFKNVRSIRNLQPLLTLNPWSRRGHVPLQQESPTQWRGVTFRTSRILNYNTV